MSFFDTSHFDAMPTAKPILPEVGFLDSIKQGYEQQIRVDSPFSLEAEIESVWVEQLKTYQRMTGEELRVPLDLQALGQYARSVRGEDQTFWNKTITGEIAPLTQKNIAALQAADEKMRALGDPNIKSFAELLDEVAAMQQQVEGETAQVGERGSFLGEIIGGIGGSFSSRDPVALATLGVGGFGRTVAAKIATEMGLAGTIVAGTEAAMTNPNRELAGLPERSVLQDALFAAAGAGILRGGAEGVAKLISRQADAAEPDFDVDFRDAQLASMFENASASPRARAGLEILQDVRQLEAASPYGASPAGLARFSAELQDVRAVLGGLVQTETALPFAVTRPAVPFEFIERAADFQIVKERSPQVWVRLEAAQARIAEIDAERVVIKTQLDEPNLIETVRLVDEDAADRLETLAAILERPDLPEPERAAVTLEADNIITRVGRDNIEKALNDSEIPARQRLKRLPKGRKAAQKRYREALAAVERERDQLQALARAQQSKEQASAIDLFTPAGLSQPLLGAHLSHDVVAEQAERLTRLADEAPDATDALVRSNLREEPTEGVLDRIGRALGMNRETEPGMVDIGLSEPVPDDFRIDIDGQEFTVRQLMDDLGEDAKLDDAMRSCLL